MLRVGDSKDADDQHGKDVALAYQLLLHSVIATCRECFLADSLSSSIASRIPKILCYLHIKI